MKQNSESVYSEQHEDDNRGGQRRQQRTRPEAAEEHTLGPGRHDEEQALLGGADAEASSSVDAGCAQQYVTAVCTDRVFGLFLLVMALNGVLVGPYLPFIPVYVEEELGATQATTATMRTLGLLGMAIFVFAGGIVTDTFGPKASLLLGLMATPAAGLLFMIGGQTTAGVNISPLSNHHPSAMYWNFVLFCGC